MIRLTKKRLAALNFELTMDNVLYEKFRRLNADLHERERKFRARREVAQVIQRRGKLQYVLQILAVHDTGKGLVVICR